MYIKDGYDGRDTVSAAPSRAQFNTCVRYLRPRRAYLLKNREGGDSHIEVGSQYAYSPIDTPVHCQIWGLSPGQIENLNG